MISGCPVHWVSRLQNEIALSTMEAEYIALSTSMKDYIPVIDIIREVYPAIGLDRDVAVKMHNTVWEDNNGALTLANLEPPRMTPRSKYYNIKYHRFRSKIKSYNIILEKVSSEHQIADILTKPLGKIKYKELKKMLNGW